MNGEYANEEIESSCHPLVCDPKDALRLSFYCNHSTNDKMACSSHDGTLLTTRRNLPSKYKTHLCKQRPCVPSACTGHQHGMLMGLAGRRADSLYAAAGYVIRHRDELVARVSAGLFVFGGNPVYYTAKGTSEDVMKEVQAVLRGHVTTSAGITSC